MRIATSFMHYQALSQMSDAQVKVNDVEQQLASGRRLNSLADDPLAAAQATEQRQSLNRFTQYQENIRDGSARLADSEVAIGSVEALLQRAKQLAITAGNDTNRAEARTAVAQELSQIRDELIAIGNSRDPNGEYLFAGHKSKTLPFVDAADGRVIYQGDQGQRWSRIAEDRQVAVTDSGHQLFLDIDNRSGLYTVEAGSDNVSYNSVSSPRLVDEEQRTSERFTLQVVTNSAGENAYQVFGSESGQLIPAPPADAVADAPRFESGRITFGGIEVELGGTPTAGDRFVITQPPKRDLFTMVGEFADWLSATPVAGSNGDELALFHERIAATLRDFDQAMTHFANHRTEIGARMNTMETQAGLNDEVRYRVESTLSELEDLDYAEAAMRMNIEMLSLQSAQQAFSKVQNLSLFNYL